MDASYTVKLGRRWVFTLFQRASGGRSACACALRGAAQAASEPPRSREGPRAAACPGAAARPAAGRGQAAASDPGASAHGGLTPSRVPRTPRVCPRRAVVPAGGARGPFPWGRAPQRLQSPVPGPRGWRLARADAAPVRAQRCGSAPPTQARNTPEGPGPGAPALTAPLSGDPSAESRGFGESGAAAPRLTETRRGASPAAGPQVAPDTALAPGARGPTSLSPSERL